MKLRSAWKPILAIAILAWVSYGSFVAAGELTGAGMSADPQPSTANSGQSFKGELLGMYLGPDLAEAPAGAVQRNEQLRAETTNCLNKLTYRPVETAERFDLDFTAPAGFVLNPLAVTDGPIMSAVAVCSETGAELGVSWDYFTPSIGRASVSRTHPTTVWQLDVAAERVSVITAGGQQAILVAPVDPERGYGSSAMVMFPRDDAFTQIYADGVPLEEILALADSVGQALTNTA
jgi:hypothetical protein